MVRADSSETEPVSLLRSEAEQRASMITVTSMRVDLDLTSATLDGPAGEVFASTATIDFRATPGGRTFLDFKGRRLISATLNGAELPDASWRSGRIELTGLAEANTVVITGEMAYSSDGEGLHRHVDPADGRTYLYAMSFLDAAPRWFACFDQPDLKSPYELEVTAPQDWTVIGNGPAVTEQPGRWRIVQERPLSTYFVTLVAGPYASVRHRHDGIELGFHVRASLGEQLQAEAEDLIEVTSQAFDYYHRTFGVRYPFGEYHQAFVPDFNAGAMENPGCITIRDQLIYRSRATTAQRAGRAGLIAHEMAHQWFGDLVTMTWWDDLWLNESFAEYVAHRCCTEATRYPLWMEFGIRKDWGRIADQAPSTHPVAGNGSADAQSALQDFDGISYAKGAAVLRQLVAYLGDDVFLGGLKDYFARHAYGNAEFADLIAAWTRAGAVELDDWAANWLRTSGLDTIAVADGVVRRIAPVDHPADRTHAIEVARLDESGAVADRTRIQLAGEPYWDRSLSPSKGPSPSNGLIVPDAADETWAKIAFDAGDWPRLTAVIGRISDPAIRLVVVNAARDAVRDAALDPAEALRLILAALPAETEDVVWEAMARFARTELTGPYCPRAERAGRTAELHRVTLAAMAGAAAGSDRQLLAFRAAIPTAADPELLRGWLAGSTLPAGLELDPDLNWALVSRLSELTGDAALIEQRLASDRSALAEQHAARARAALPDAAAKASAWELLMRPSTASAYQVYATAEGFFRPDQDELAADYVRRYFAEVGATAGFRTGWALGRTAELAYPYLAVSEETLALAEQTLAGNGLADPLRRALIDGTDRLRRAVAARRRFG
ncbi:aminopeptidase N [Microlunatus parietis]|uniref:Aminopeptidase N n=1 Tax=Microlunatus parietis TaxID=682979 RepID=A0A7Y9I5C5_9ACTN|nr:aminopeptidase N [Microlunatus parietis]NYE70296.1 aminopeptidase N [Microlunatus parietis]